MGHQTREGTSSVRLGDSNGGAEQLIYSALPRQHTPSLAITSSLRLTLYSLPTLSTFIISYLPAGLDLAERCHSLDFFNPQDTMHCNRFFSLLALVASVAAAPQGIVVVPIEITNCTILEAPVAQAAAILEGFRSALQGVRIQLPAPFHLFKWILELS